MQQAATFGRRNVISNAGVTSSFERQQSIQRDTASPQHSNLPSYKSLLDSADAGAKDGPTSHFNTAQYASQISEVDMMRAIGNNWHKYREVWEQMEGRPRLVASAGFVPFFFNALWLAYRKQYSAVFILILASMGVGFISLSFSLYFNLGMMVAVGMYGRSLVVMNTMKSLQAIRSLPISDSEMNRKIEKAGGTSVMAVVFYMIFNIACVVISFERIGSAMKNQKNQLSSPFTQTQTMKKR